MEILGKYQIFAEIYQGPITTLYKAFDPQLERTVFIKRFNPECRDDHELCSRFQQEGLMIAQFHHPNVISIFDYCAENQIPYLVMEYIEGTSLASIIKKQGPLPQEIAVYIFYQTLQGLAELHKNRLIHRDLKPDNVMISDEGIVKLGDLGFAERKLITDVHLLGTPAYMAPEVILSQVVDERSDIFSAGVLFYEILTGTNPFNTTNIAATLKRIANIDLLPLHKTRPNIPETISLICQRMLARDPQQRFASVELILKELRPLLQNANADSLKNFLSNPDGYVPIPLESSPPLHTPLKAKIRLPHMLFSIFLLIGLFIIVKLIVQKVQTEKPMLTIKNKNSIDSAAVVEKNMSPSVLETTAPPSIQKKQSQRIEAKDNHNISSTFTTRDSLSLAEQLEHKSITIRSDPRAWVIIDHDSIGITPLTYRLPSTWREITIKLKSPGFPLLSKRIALTDVSDQDVYLSLWQEVGYLDITVIPWGEIWIDGDSVNVMPLLTPILLAPGSHQLLVQHPYLKQVQELIHIVAGDTLKKSIMLLNQR